MAKPHEESGEEQALKPEMRDLILKFDAKDRREAGGKKPREKGKDGRRRGDKPARAA
jgi:hypothetical protein